MIYICSAMYIEAEPFIKTLNLKKDTNITQFQMFRNENFILLITGIGKIKSSIAATYMLTKYTPHESDIFLNIGFCGSQNMSYKIGQEFLCNKIIDNDTEKTYFTDILFKHPFKETNIETFSTIIHSKKQTENINGDLVDMESSALYETALTFMQPHQIFFIKIISDYLNTHFNEDNASKLKLLINNSSKKIIPWITELNEKFNYSKDILSPKDIELIDKLSNNLKLSCTMKNQFKQIIKYNELLNNSFSDIISTTLHLKCKSKKEGKIYLEEIKKRFI
ncbi:MAG: 5'-methylthioadenosine/S-adenosylhomocysteine nucleosidase [Clostridium butyricum]|nr:5'-methylthioadenosine/S-adenosylhomocysteine nucleosidase [Clostridium butyricum]